MDLSHFGLACPPFESTPSPAHFVNLPQHWQAVEALREAIDGRRGIVLLTGVPGTGKTLVTRVLAQRFGAGAAVGSVLRPCTSADDLLNAVADAFRLQAGKPRTQPAHAIEQFVEDLYQQDIPAVLIIENAHELPNDALELVGQLAMLEADDMPLIQMVLSGWPTLNNRFVGVAGAAIRQRIDRHIALEPLQEADTGVYIRGRMRNAGAPERDVFTEGAMRAIHRRTGGIPRLINRLCEALLAHASDKRTHMIEADSAERLSFEIEVHPRACEEAPTTAPVTTALRPPPLEDQAVIRTLLDRVGSVENAVAALHREIGRSPTAPADLDRRMRRYDRICDRVLPLLRVFRRRYRETETVLGRCRQSAERVEQMLAEPLAVLDEARAVRDEIQSTWQSIFALLPEARELCADMDERVDASRQIVDRMTDRLNDAAPSMERTQRLVEVLRQVCDATDERCLRLERLAQEAREMCDALSARLTKVQTALTRPEPPLSQALSTTAQIREAIEQARQSDQARTAARTPTRPAPATPPQSALPRTERRAAARHTLSIPIASKPA